MVNKGPVFLQSISGLDRQVPYHPSSIFFERRVIKIVQKVFLAPGSILLRFLNTTHLQKSLNSVIVVLIIEGLVVLHSVIERLDYIVESLARVVSQCFVLFLLVFLSLDDTHTLTFNFIKFVVVFEAFQLVHVLFVFVDCRFNRSYHLILFVFEDVLDLLCDLLFFQAGFLSAVKRPLVLHRVRRQRKRLRST